jgi:hypothetical protein
MTLIVMALKSAGKFSHGECYNFTECHYVKCHCAECKCAECHCAECHHKLPVACTINILQL